jgi:hypothetical protein
MFRRSLKELSDRPQVTVKGYDRVSESDSNSRDTILHKVKDESRIMFPAKPMRSAAAGI